MSILVTIGLLALAISASLAVFVVYPSAMTSMLRYKLWPIRDELFDAIVADEFEDVEQAERLLQQTEISIEHASELRIGRMLLLAAIARGKTPPDVELFDLDRAHPADRARLEQLWRREITAIIWHVLTGSVLGLPATAVVIVLAAIRAFVWRGPKDGRSEGSAVEYVVQHEIPVEKTLVVLSERPRTSRLGLTASV